MRPQPGNAAHQSDKLTPQVVLEGADLTSTHTLGLVREGPCRRLAEVAMSRYEALGLWKECTLESIQVASSLSLIAQGAHDRLRIHRYMR